MKMELDFSEADITLKEMQELLKGFAEVVTDNEARKETLQAMADPVVEEARRITAPGGGIFRGDGRLSKSIVSEWSPNEPSHIDIGYTSKGYYGAFWEKGFFHKGSKKFLRRRHLRPALTAKKREGMAGAIKVLRRHLDKAER